MFPKGGSGILWNGRRRSLPVQEMVGCGEGLTHFLSARTLGVLEQPPEGQISALAWDS